MKAGSPPAGYSGTPLANKLGIAAGARVFAEDVPHDYAHLLAPIPKGVVFEKRLSASTDVAHVFVARKTQLKKQLAALRKGLRADGTVWISWPKKASKVPTDVTEDVVRELALPLGFVDVKVCAVSEVWSGLKLVVRKELR